MVLRIAFFLGSVITLAILAVVHSHAISPMIFDTQERLRPPVTFVADLP